MGGGGPHVKVLHWNMFVPSKRNSNFVHQTTWKPEPEKDTWITLGNSHRIFFIVPRQITAADAAFRHPLVMAI